MEYSLSNPPTKSLWYKNPMVLMVIAIPLTSVVVSFTFLGIAIHSFDGVVVDDYYRQGKEINRLMLRDETATRLGLVADVGLNGDQVVATLSSAQPIDWPQSIEFGILHPTQNGRDHKLLLTRHTADARTDQVYQADLPSFSAGEWIVQLTTPTWRLMHRGKLDSHAKVRLQAAPTL